MRTVSDNYADPFSIDGSSHSGRIDGLVLDEIGDGLRQVYGPVIDSEMPQSLRELAEIIDARRGERAGD